MSFLVKFLICMLITMIFAHKPILAEIRAHVPKEWLIDFADFLGLLAFLAFLLFFYCSIAPYESSMHNEIAYMGDGL